MHAYNKMSLNNHNAQHKKLIEEFDISKDVVCAVDRKNNKLRVISVCGLPVDKRGEGATAAFLRKIASRQQKLLGISSDVSRIKKEKILILLQEAHLRLTRGSTAPFIEPPDQDGNTKPQSTGGKASGPVKQQETADAPPEQETDGIDNCGGLSCDNNKNNNAFCGGDYKAENVPTTEDRGWDTFDDVTRANIGAYG